jgi:hypothetical protein
MRSAHFEERSQLPVQAACVVAGGMRERLATILGAPVSLHVLEPRIPTAGAWQAIVRAAWIYAVRGSVTDAAIVLRPRDAVAVASAAFGETVAVDAGERALSAMEREVLERTAATLAGTLAAVCGEMREAGVGKPAVTSAFATYFEVAVDRPLRACIGIAVAREPRPEPCGTLSPNDLAAVPLTLSARMELGTLTAAATAALAIGDVVPIIPPRALHGTLRTSGRRLAAGTCGVRNGRYALEIEGN